MEYCRILTQKNRWQRKEAGNSDGAGVRAIARVTSGCISRTANSKNAEAFALVDLDTVTCTHSDTSGYFRVIGLLEGSYSAQIVADDVTYAATTFSDAAVVAGQATDLGGIQLREEYLVTRSAGFEPKSDKAFLLFRCARGWKGQLSPTGYAW